MSNELSTPKVLVCPADKGKVTATNFSSGFSDTNVSYFVGLDGKDTYPQMLLSGDRNLATNGRALKPGLFLLDTNDTSALGWTRAIHTSKGNIALADGSVQFIDGATLQTAARNQEWVTNRLAIP